MGGGGNKLTPGRESRGESRMGVGQREGRRRLEARKWTLQTNRETERKWTLDKR